jgi:DNA-binding CsgD family transcriptional regulator
VSSADLPNDAALGLIGRDEELRLLYSFLDQAAASGSALLISGDAGVGKTACLEAGAAAAAAAGTQVVRAGGTEFEAEVSYSGLNQIVLPLLGGAQALSAEHRDALLGALGLGVSAGTVDRLVVFSAMLALLRQAAADRPLLVVVDDAQWLDRASAVALGFAARRLSGTRVGILAGLRLDAEGFFDSRGLPELVLRPLPEASAAALLQGRFPSLAWRVRQRVLVEAAGNPLALLELPAELSASQRATRHSLPSTLPLSRRLQEAFAARVARLPAPTRHLLLLAVLDGTGDLGVLAAEGTLDDLVPAEQLRLVRIDEGTRRLAFGHPLIRSAIVESSTASERQRCHRLLAELLPDQPDRRAWHLAEASIGPDGQVADLLEQSAYRVLRRGDAVAAVATLIRAAQISLPGPDRNRRLVTAAYLGADVTGELHDVSRLLAEARQTDPGLTGSLQAASAAAYLMLNGEGKVDTAYRLLTGAIEGMFNEYDASDLALTEALRTLMWVCLWAERLELWGPFDNAIARLGTQIDPALDLEVKTMVDPVRTMAASLKQLDRAMEDLGGELDPARIVRIANTSIYLDWRGGHREEALWRVVSDGRRGGAVTSAISAMALLCIDEFLTGQWDDALSLADEGLRLAGTHGYQLSTAPYYLVRALVAAARGDYATADDLSSQMTRWGAPRGVGGMLTFARHIRTLAALSRGDFEESYRQVTGISPAGVFPSHLAHALLVPMYVVEAAVRSGRHEEASAHVAAMREAKIAKLSPRLALLVAGSTAIAASAEDAQQLFAEALGLPDLDRWPFETARIRLAFGEHLRRVRATSQARMQLSAALETFDWLGATPWAARAANELRAAGAVSASAFSPGPSLLTPQELQIAQLAAAGLTNKQIAEQLFLSPRTVGSHLYRIFPRLGITTRAALRDALNREPDHESSNQAT